MSDTQQPVRCGIEMDKLRAIIDRLDADPRLQRIFGTPVSRCLAVVSEEGDMRIEELGRVQLSDHDRQVFLEVLEHVVREFAAVSL